MIELTATATEDLSLGAAPAAGNVVDAHDHVPGSVLRGALAARWIRAHGPPDSVGAVRRAEFVELFERSISYGPLLPVGATVVPLSVLRCKYRPRPACAEVAVDLAALAEPPAACAECGGPLQPSKGGLDGAIPLVDRTRTALDADERAQEATLHTRRVLPAGTELRGHVHGVHPWLADLDGATIWLGGRRTVGGRARLTARPAGELSTPAARDDERVVVVLTTPGIFVDDAGRPTYAPPLADVAGVLGTEVEVEARWVRPTRVAGWHAASGLPKPQEVALVAGSTFVLRPRGAVSAEALAALRHTGLGLRRAEGFGLVSVNPDPWRPSRPSAAAAVQGSPARELARRTREVITDADERDWLVKQLKRRRTVVERGGSAIDDPMGARRLRGATRPVRDLVEELLALEDPDIVRDVLALLTDPGVAR